MNRHLLILALFPLMCQAQVVVDFEDGRLDKWQQLPAFRWEVSGMEPISGAWSLHHAHDHPDAGDDRLFLKMHTPDPDHPIRYAFRVRHTYSPSRNNNWQFLVQAEPGLDGSLAGGMVFGVNFDGSDDLISLWQIDHEGITTVIQSEINYQDSIGTVAAPLFSLARDPGGCWTIGISCSGEEGELFNAGSGYERSFSGGRYLGIRYAYTSAQDRKLWVDDIRIEGHFTPDSDPPVIDSVTLFYPNRAEVFFNEPVHPSPDFHCLWNESAPDSVSFSGSRLLLCFPGSFPNRQPQTIKLYGISDSEGNVLDEAEAECYLDLSEYGDVVINEVMADPYPAVYLPECEYLELFNRYMDTIELGRWMLRAGSREILLPDFALAPGHYAVLTASEETCRFPGVPVLPLFSSSSLLSNQGAGVALYDPYGRLVHVLEYPPVGSLDPLKSDGGWSVERLDPDAYCEGLKNWSVSADPLGGTPGRKNSRQLEIADDEEPVMIFFGLPDPYHLEIEFSERIFLEGGAHAAVLSMDGKDLLPEPESDPHVSRTLLFAASGGFSEGVSYPVRISTLADCAGNRMEAASFTFRLPGLPEQGQVVINEVMFDPGFGGAEYIELHNPSDAFIDLSDLKMQVASHNGITGSSVLLSDRSHILTPGCYVVLTPAPWRLEEQFNMNPGADIIIPEDWPYLNNAGGCICLSDRSERIVDRMCYDPSMHHDLLAETGGVSLERISPELDGDDPGNWTSAASSRGYGTPGKRNSQYLPFPSGELQVAVSPRVVSPDMDGYRERVVIDIHLPDGQGVVTVLVTDLHGYRVKSIADRAIGSPDETLFWDATDDHGHLVSPGMYVIHIRIYNGKKEKVIREVVAVTYR